MIDLTRTRAGLLAEIGAPHPAAGPLSDIAELRVGTTDAQVCIRGHTQGDLFPLLKLAFSEWFARVPREQLIGDLLMPLKSALGNAFKHGNGNSPAKAVSVEMVLTHQGAVIVVTDEGPGFDVALTFRQFQEQQVYFVNQGAGFRSLHQTRSTVSYENGGRSIVLCFQPRADSEHISRSGPAAAGNSITGPGTQAQGSEDSLPTILDSEWIQTCLSAEAAEFRENGDRIESCRVYAAGGRAGDDWGNRYLLRVVRPDGTAEKRTLTGRLHATEAAAAADLEAATRLRESKISKSVLIPRPVARLTGEPRLVFYDFDPWMNLWEYLAYRRSGKALRHCAEGVGRALARLHGSRILPAGGVPDRVGEGLPAVVARAQTSLQALTSGSDLVNRFRHCVQRIQERAAFGRPPVWSPIHGALGWDCILYDVKGQLCLYRFETLRWSDPGLDLGGFAADLLCFTLAKYESETYRLCCNAFLRSYNSKAEHPMDEDDFRSYLALALAQRLCRADSGQTLAALDLVLPPRDGGEAVRSAS